MFISNFGQLQVGILSATLVQPPLVSSALRPRGRFHHGFVVKICHKNPFSWMVSPAINTIQPPLKSCFLPYFPMFSINKGEQTHHFYRGFEPRRSLQTWPMSCHDTLRSVGVNWFMWISSGKI